MSDAMLLLLIPASMAAAFLPMWVPICFLPWLRKRKRRKRETQFSDMMNQHCEAHRHLELRNRTSASEAMMLDQANEKRMRGIASNEAWRVALNMVEGRVPTTATCHICGKWDFMDNLADVGWMDSRVRPIKKDSNMEE